MTGNIDVVVIGGGYAGVMAANRLTRRDDLTVTLINRRGRARDGTANGVYLGGRLAVKIKKLAMKGMVERLADEARKPGSYTWPVKDDKRRLLLEAKRGEAPAGAERGV